MSILRSLQLGVIRSPRRRALATATALVAAIAVAGCSGSGPEQAASAPATSAAGASAVTCPSPAAPPVAAKQSTLQTPGGPRTYYAWTPTGYDGTKPVALVVDYHGTGGEALHYSTTFSGMVRDGLGRGYMVVAPQAIHGVWGAPGYTGAGDDVTYTKLLVDSLRTQYCIDPNRIYASGFSLGGGFTNYISCVLDIWAAVAPEGGVNFARPCPNQPPMPVIVWHGRNDPIAPYGSDSVATDSPRVAGENYVGNVPYDVDQWAVRNKCQPGRIDTVINPDVMKRTYTCPMGAEVVLYTHSGGHTLPGSIPLPPAQLAFRGPQVMSIDAPKLTLDFFDAHRRSTPPASAPVATDSSGFPIG